MTKQEIIDFIREAIELKNKTEGVLTTTLKYKLENEGKYLYGQYNSIK